MRHPILTENFEQELRKEGFIITANSINFDHINHRYLYQIDIGYKNLLLYSTKVWYKSGVLKSTMIKHHWIIFKRYRIAHNELTILIGKLHKEEKQKAVQAQVDYRGKGLKKNKQIW